MYTPWRIDKTAILEYEKYKNNNVMLRDMEEFSSPYCNNSIITLSYDKSLKN
jgi:hypothetical protein